MTCLGRYCFLTGPGMAPLAQVAELQGIGEVNFQSREVGSGLEVFSNV
jgi:hypothetical protein